MKHIVIWRQALLVLCLSCSSFAFSQEEKEIRQNGISVNESNELIEQLKNMPFIEVGKGVSFQSKNNTFGMTMRARMQSLLEFDLDEDFHHTSMDAEVKRIRLNFEGYVLSPKLLYSIQLGFAPNDTRTVLMATRTSCETLSSITNRTLLGTSGLVRRKSSQTVPIAILPAHWSCGPKHRGRTIPFGS